MQLLKKPDGDMEMVPACAITIGWMTGWAFAWWLSDQFKVGFATAMVITYVSLVVLVIVAVWENTVYWKHVLRINELMHR